MFLSSLSPSALFRIIFSAFCQEWRHGCTVNSIQCFFDIQQGSYHPKRPLFAFRYTNVCRHSAIRQIDQRLPQAMISRNTFHFSIDRRIPRKPNYPESILFWTWIKPNLLVPFSKSIPASDNGILYRCGPPDARLLQAKTLHHQAYCLLIGHPAKYLWTN